LPDKSKFVIFNIGMLFARDFVKLSPNLQFINYKSYTDLGIAAQIESSNWGANDNSIFYKTICYKYFPFYKQYIKCSGASWEDINYNDYSLTTFGKHLAIG